jgi:hypothetical protein
VKEGTQANLERVASLFESAASEFRTAADHLDLAGRHFRNGEVPRGGAHAFAALGHAQKAQESLHEAAKLHSEASTVDP